ncbi:MAG: hypothetical protein COA42_16860 [Alteromonadaceae bacterium]|nr:MAG: hypothetical protein COA42_16860 [Alteromonadaceae bacterium]
MNLGMYLGAAGLIASLSLAFLWQAEKAKSAELQGRLELREQHVLTLKANLERLNTQVEEVMKLVTINATLQSKYDEDVATERLKVDDLQNEINDLRAKELEDAMQDPFNRGNSATQRWNNVMQRISGIENRETENSNDSSITESGDTGTADGTGN